MPSRARRFETDLKMLLTSRPHRLPYRGIAFLQFPNGKTFPMWGKFKRKGKHGIAMELDHVDEPFSMTKAKRKGKRR
jgi:hypothetical protein